MGTTRVARLEIIRHRDRRMSSFHGRDEDK